MGGPTVDVVVEIVVEVVAIVSAVETSVEVGITRAVVAGEVIAVVGACVDSVPTIESRTSSVWTSLPVQPAPIAVAMIAIVIAGRLRRESNTAVI
jgi:hypothetical protein